MVVLVAFCYGFLLVTSLILFREHTGTHARNFGPLAPAPATYSQRVSFAGDVEQQVFTSQIRAFSLEPQRLFRESERSAGDVGQKLNMDSKGVKFGSLVTQARILI